MRLEFYEQFLLFILLPANGFQSRRIRRIVIDPLLVAAGRDCQKKISFWWNDGGNFPLGVSELVRTGDVEPMVSRSSSI